MIMTKNLTAFIEHKNLPLNVGGCMIGQKLFLSACLKEFFVYVVNNSEKLYDMAIELQTLGRKPKIMSYSDINLSYSLFVDENQKISLLNDIVENKCDCLIIDARCLLQKYPDMEKFKRNYIKIEVNQLQDREKLNLQLLGYQRVQKVEKVGQYAIRGDILDIYAPNNSVRISFFDDEVESIKLIDFETNKILSEVKKISICPNTLIFEEDLPSLRQVVETLKAVEKPDAQATFSSVLSMVKDELQNLGHINSLQWLSYEVCNSNLFDYLTNYIVVVDEPQMVNESLNNHILGLNKQINDYFISGQIYQDFKRNYVSKQDILSYLNKSIIFDSFKEKHDIIFDSTVSQNYKNKPELLIYDLKEMQSKNYSISIFASSEIDRGFLGDILNNKAIQFSVVPTLDKSFESGLKIVTASLPESCILNEEKIALLPYGNIKYVKKSTKNVEKPFFELPQEGDYVVHDFHGIGLCLGIQKMKVGGYQRDYIVIKYEGTDKLYLPVENADSISKYVGQENPKLNKIGGAEFERAKTRVRQQLEVMATDMLKIYAEREKSKGYRYEVDTFIQQQFDESFAYEETTDQLKAIDDIKNDMSSSRIMDRLICGDVGYGKTEVAFRSAMIAIDNGKQVLMLAPTTILSEQHYKSALARFKDFGVRIAVLNRFKTIKEQKIIAEKLENGEIDLLIGTQKALSDKLKFKDLGLLICDEEQKLGVKDKEKIKKLKHNIDVISMSATPIPRTLHMSLVGIRDISTIATAPQMRKSVQTTICEYNLTLVKSAVEKELERGGQVLIVKNRVEGLEDYVYKLRNAMPDVKIAYAHGQMDKDKLENTMKEVFDCKIDVLVATTLIENGIDLPNLNTMLVIDADKFGLSTLYQLRGRVGRSSQQAYAYFTFDTFKGLSQDGAKRLQAMQEYTELGSGFKIAMRDLELRGAGTVLGEKQSGHLEKVGYDMYCKLLEQVISALKGKEEQMTAELRVDVDINAEIPNFYIKDSETKMEVIDRISKLKNKLQLNKEIENLSSEFGTLPKETLNLAKIATLKNLFREFGATSITFKANGKNQIEFSKEPNLPKTILSLGEMQNDGGKIVFKLSKNIDLANQIDLLLNNL